MSFRNHQFEYQLMGIGWYTTITRNLHSMELLSPSQGVRVYTKKCHTRYLPEEFVMCLRYCLFADMVHTGWLNGPLRLVMSHDKA